MGLATGIGEPIPVVSGFHTNGQSRQKWIHEFDKAFEIIGHVAAKEHIAGLVHDGDEHRAGMQVDAAIVLGVNLSEHHSDLQRGC